METRASYIAVGSFVLVVALGIAVFLVWLGAGSLQQERDLYRIFFSGSVTGLQEGSAVRYRGVPVGNVEDIRINPENLEEIEVTVALEPGTPIVEDNIARLDLQGLAGGAYILISGGSESSPPLEREAGAPPPVIEAVPAPLERLYTSVPDLIEQANRVLTRAESFLSDDNARTLTETVTETRALIAALNDDQTGLPAVLARVEALATTLDGLGTEVRVDVARLSDRLDSTLGTASGEITEISAELQAVAADLQQLAATYTTVGNQVSGILAQSRSGITEFAQTGLYEFTLMTSQLRGLADSLSRLVTRFERDPAQFLLGDTSSGVELD